MRTVSNEVKKIDDDTARTNASDIGCIQLDICLVRTDDPDIDSSESSATFSSIADDAIHEKAKKLGGHRTTYATSHFVREWF